MEKEKYDKEHEEMLKGVLEISQKALMFIEENGLKEVFVNYLKEGNVEKKLEKEVETTEIKYNGYLG